MRGLPPWIPKWIALVLSYAEYEEKELKQELLQLRYKMKGEWFNKLIYTEESAQIECNGVLENRRQNIAITVNKLRHFMQMVADDPSDCTSFESPIVRYPTQKYLSVVWNGKNRSPASLLVEL